MTEDVNFVGRFDDTEILKALGEVSAGVEKTQNDFEQMASSSSESFAKAAQSLKTANAGYRQSIIQIKDSILDLERKYNNFTNKGSAGARQLRERIKELRLESRSYSLSLAENNEKIKQFGEQAKQSFGKTADSMKLTTNQSQNLTFQLNDIFAQVGAGTSVLQTLIQQGPQITQVFGGVGNTFRFLGRSILNSIKSIFTLRGGVTALAGALVALTAVGVAAYFRKSQEAGDRFQQSMAGLGARFDIVVGRVFEFGESITKVFSGEAMKGEVLENLTRIFSGYSDELDRAAETARKFTEVQQVLGRAANEFIVNEGQALRVVDELRASVDNETLSVGKRTKALQEAGKIERGLETERIRAATLQAAALKAKIEQESAAGGISVEQGKLIADAERKVIDLLREASNRQRADASTLRSIRQQRADDLEKEKDKVNALNEAYKKLLGQLSSRAEKARISELLGTDKLQAEKEAALKEVDAFVNETAAAATAAGRSLPDGFASDVQDLVSAIETEFRKATDKLREKDGDVLSQLLLPKDQANGLETEAQRAFARLEGVFNNNLPLLQRVKDGIAQAFGLSREELEEGFQLLSQGFGQAFTAFNVGIDANTEARIIQQDKLIEAIRNRIDETEELLQKEEDREREGFANSAQTYRDKLKADEAALKLATDARLALEEKAAKRTLFLNSLQQGSEATLTIVKLLSASASLGIFGFIAAAAVGVSTVFSIIAQAKAQAAKFAQPQGLKDGTPFVTGPGNSRSDSIPANLSVGERVMDAASNAAVGGVAVSNPELVRLALKGREMEAQAAGAVQDRQREIDAWNMQRETSFQGLTESQMERMTDKVIGYLKTRPVRKFGSQGEFIEFREGDAVIRQLVPPPPKPKKG